MSKKDESIQRVLGRLEVGQTLGFSTINAHLATLNGTVAHHAVVISKHAEDLASIASARRAWWSSAKAMWTLLGSSVFLTWNLSRLLK